MNLLSLNLFRNSILSIILRTINFKPTIQSLNIRKSVIGSLKFLKASKITKHAKMLETRENNQEIVNEKIISRTFLWLYQSETKP
jgi:hypothetical protein